MIFTPSIALHCLFQISRHGFLTENYIKKVCTLYYFSLYLSTMITHYVQYTSKHLFSRILNTVLNGLTIIMYIVLWELYRSCLFATFDLC